MRLFLCLFLIVSSPAHALQCRQALVLALDVSGSVNEEEYQQQINGLAAALDSEAVRSLILFGADAPVSLAVFEWSSRNHQLLIQPWISLDGANALDLAIARIRAHRKQRAGLKTALGTSLMFAQALLEQRPDCWLHTIDVSGDGPNNIGATPQEVYQSIDFGRTTVNALVIGNTGWGTAEADRALEAYYQSSVIRGPAAFTMTAHGYSDYARAMQRKLERELQHPMLGQFDNGNEAQQPG